MDRIEKALRKLNEKEKTRLRRVFSQLRAGSLTGLDIKKLQGRHDIFRARKGDLRIIYQLKNNTIFILAIEHRSNKTYKK